MPRRCLGVKKKKAAAMRCVEARAAKKAKVEADAAATVAAVEAAAESVAAAVPPPAGTAPPRRGPARSVKGGGSAETPAPPPPPRFDPILAVEEQDGPISASGCPPGWTQHTPLGSSPSTPGARDVKSPGGRKYRKQSWQYRERTAAEGGGGSSSSPGAAARVGLFGSPLKCGESRADARARQRARAADEEEARASEASAAASSAASAKMARRYDHATLGCTTPATIMAFINVSMLVCSVCLQSPQFLEATHCFHGGGGELRFNAQCACSTPLPFGGVGIPLLPVTSLMTTASNVLYQKHAAVITVGHALAFTYALCGRPFFREYAAHIRMMGSSPFSRPTFQRTIKQLHGILKQISINEHEIAMRFLKRQGRWYSASIVIDGSWSKRGYDAPYGIVVVRDTLTGVELASYSMGRNNPDYPWQCTSTAMEIFGALVTLKGLKLRGLGSSSIECTFDGDTTTPQLVLALWGWAIILACCQHKNKSLGKNVLANSKRKKVKGIEAKCTCAGKDHSHKVPYCGCGEGARLVQFLKKNNMKMMIEAGKMAMEKGPEVAAAWYAKNVRLLVPCLQGVHTHTTPGGETVECWHHDDDFTLSDTLRTDCPFHLEYIQLQIEGLAEAAPQLFTKDGCASGNPCEGGFAIMWGLGIKSGGGAGGGLSFESMDLAADGIGNRRANQGPLHMLTGDDDYDWVLEAFKLARLPVPPRLVKQLARSRELRRKESVKCRSELTRISKSKGKNARFYGAAARRLFSAYLKRAMGIRSTKHTASAAHTVSASRATMDIDGMSEVKINELELFDSLGAVQSALRQKKNGKTIVALDLNGMLCFQHSLSNDDGSFGGYGSFELRPHVAEFLGMLRKRKDVKLAVWCGARSSKRALELVREVGLNPKELLFCAHNWNPAFRWRGKNRMVEGTTAKVKTIKPVVVQQSLFPMYSRFVLVDDEKYKSDGFSDGSLSNPPGTHIEVPTYPGVAVAPDDDALEPDVGASAVELIALLNQLRVDIAAEQASAAAVVPTAALGVIV